MKNQLPNNVIRLVLKSTPFNGYPKIRVLLDGVVLTEHELGQDMESVEVELPRTITPSAMFSIERWGKDHTNFDYDADNNVMRADQILELVAVFVDDIEIPDYIINQGCFVFDGQTHPASRYWGPNGFWNLTISLPVVDFVLTEKMRQEDKYSGGYYMTNSYTLTEQSIAERLAEIEEFKEQLNNL